MAVSLDGYVADAHGEVGWLDAWVGQDFGFDVFLAGVGPLVMRRRTCEQSRGFGDRPYAGHPCRVVTSSPLLDPPEQVEAWTHGVGALAERLRAERGADCRVVGGPQLQCAFIEGGALDRLELYVMPVLLGQGLRLFPEGCRGRGRLYLAAAQRLAGEVVRLDCRMESAPASGPRNA
jgi:dihydrofolate reductase